MSRCIVCNKRVAEGNYFCHKCLKEQVGEPPKRSRFSIWSLFSPFSAAQFTIPGDNDQEISRWLVQEAYRLTEHHPTMSPEAAIITLCENKGIDSETIHQTALAELTRLIALKKGPEWAPWDIILQPGIQLLVLALGALGLILLLLG
jgi:hypothetical protein